MIELRTGNILLTDAEALVNTVNCVGIMGRGIALQFKKAFPENYKAYKIACDRKEVQLGKMFVYDLARLENPRYIINFPTKQHWRNKSRLADIKSGLQDFVAEIKRRKINSVAIPPLGCGLGGLNWDDVLSLIRAAMEELPEVTAFVFEPSGAPEAQRMVNKTKKPHLTPGRAALLALTGRYLSGLMDYKVTLLEIHKLLYFLQESGEDLRLIYEKGPFGPYAKNLRHVLNLLEGHYLSGFGDGNDKPTQRIELLGDAVQKGEAFLEKSIGTRTHFEKVSELISGYETPFGMELLSTVHWVKEKEGASSIDDAMGKIYAWNSRKKNFTEDHIKVAWESLEEWNPQQDHDHMCI